MQTPDGQVPPESAPPAAPVIETTPRARPGRISLRGIVAYEWCDRWSGFLLCVMALFAPWAFGTTQPWSIWTLNIAGYVVGALLCTKLWVRWVQRHQPPRWFNPDPNRLAAGFTTALAIITLLILLYCLIAAVNARASYRPRQFAFDYFDHFITWLPHSYDRGRSWQAFWNYLALALSFWALRDWLLGKTRAEERAARGGATGGRPRLPARLRRLLWVLGINGGLLALEGIVQRLEGSGTLLFMVRPRVNPDALSQFGPYAYRANASQYLNMLWPLAVGLWWTLRRVEGAGRHGRFDQRNQHHLLLLGAILMAAAPIISTSRGGALIALLQLTAVTLLLFLALRRDEGLVRLAILLLFGASIGLGVYVGWDSLGGRMDELYEGFTQREEMFRTAQAIARDYPLFGTGPGTFEYMFQFYRASLEEFWPAQLHNDWLEALTNFGWVGCSLLGLALAVAVWRPVVPGGIFVGTRFPMLLWIAVGGCLLHARWDFPFQIYSIVFLFLIVCAVLSVLTLRRTKR